MSGLDTERLVLGPWPRGVLYCLDSEQVPYDALTAMQNCVINRVFEAEGRLGFAKYFDSAISENPTIQGLGKQRFSSSSTAVWFVAGTKFYVDVSGTPTDRTGGMTITAGQDNQFDDCDAGGTLAICSLTNGQFKLATAAGNLAALDVDARFTKADLCTFWDNRLWLGHTAEDPSAVWYSDQNDIETFGVTASFWADSSLTALVPGFVKDSNRDGIFLCAHTKEGIWCAIKTEDATVPYAWRRKTNVGASGKKCVTILPDGRQLFLHDDGPYLWDGINEPERMIAMLGSRYWDNVNTDRLQYAHSVVDTANQRAWFFLPYGTAQGNNNHVIQAYYFTDIEGLDRVLWMGPQVGFSRNCSAYFDRQVYAGGVADGQLWKHDEGTSDDGTPIPIKITLSGAPPIDISTDVMWIMATVAIRPEIQDLTLIIRQTGPELPSRSNSLAVGVDADAIETSFIIETSSIRGSETSYMLDVDMHGWGRSTQLEIRCPGYDIPIRLKQVVEHYNFPMTKQRPTSGAGL